MKFVYKGVHSNKKNVVSNYVVIGWHGRGGGF